MNEEINGMTWTGALSGPDRDQPEWPRGARGHRRIFFISLPVSLEFPWPLHYISDPCISTPRRPRPRAQYIVSPSCRAAVVFCSILNAYHHSTVYL